MDSSETLQDDRGYRFRCCKKKLGRGTFADVYLGEWLNPPTDGPPQFVAIKQFYLTKQTLSRALSSEIDIMRSLDHPNIVKMISVIADTAAAADEYTTENRLWVIMELCDGGDLRTFLKKPEEEEEANAATKTNRGNEEGRPQRRVSEKWARKYMQQIASGLQYLRSKQIIHRDLKPHNLLMSKDRQTIKIADFGFARILGSEALEAPICGTPLYMSPQVLRGEQYSSKADLWSVGIILYEMLCGVKPFREIRDITMLTQKVSHEPIRFPKSVQISGECRKLLTDLLRKDEKERIDWEQFFQHPWFSLVGVTTTQQQIPRSTPPVQQIPRSAPITIPNARMIPNYMDRLGGTSAPVPTIRAQSAQSPQSDYSASSVDIFAASTAATTPYGGSEPFGHFSGDEYTEYDNDSDMVKPKRSLTAVSNFFSTGLGLLKDSFQKGL